MQESTINIANTSDEATLVNGKIAPGTKGQFNIEIDGEGTEVSIEYKVDFANETNKPTNLKFEYNNVEYTSLEELKKELIGYIDVNDNNKKVVITIFWKWEYETGSDKEINNNDKIDTEDGKNRFNYSFNVIVTGTQANL